MIRANRVLPRTHLRSFRGMNSERTRSRGALVALFMFLPALAFTGCQSSPGNAHSDTGTVYPTVAGRSPASFGSSSEAQLAFTRQSKDGGFMAILEDAAWLKFEGSPDQVEKEHKSYFRDGYTTFKVVMTPEQFSQPNKEVFILEDDSGQRFKGNPISYNSAMEWTGRKYRMDFPLSFQHAVTARTRWIKLIRERDGATLRWNFSAGSLANLRAQ